MNFDRMSLRWRVTLGSTAIAALVFALAGVVFQAQVASILSSTTETLLQHDAAPFRAEIVRGADPLDEPGKAQLVAVIDPEGIIRRSTLPPDLHAKLATLLTFGAEPRTYTTKSGEYLVLREAVVASDGEWSIIAARKLEATQLVLERLTGALVVGALVLLVAFGVASWLLTGAALRPVSRLRRHASRLSESSEPVLLPVGPARDELAALASTLNDFLRQQRAVTTRERQMVSDASHELRSPLAVLKAQLELAHLHSGDATALEASIRDAERSVERLTRMATDLLELSELESAAPFESSRGHSPSTWAALVGELGAAVDRARARGAEAGIVIDYTVSGDRDAAEYGLGVERFGRVIDNLTDNALHAMHAAGRGGTVSVALRQSRRACELVISDTGPGVPEDFLPVAFDRFTRPDRSRSQETGGTGLGLAIVRAIALDAQGSARMANRDTGGLEVTLTIPEREIESVSNPEQTLRHRGRNPQ